MRALNVAILIAAAGQAGRGSAQQHRVVAPNTQLTIQASLFLHKVQEVSRGLALFGILEHRVELWG